YLFLFHHSATTDIYTLSLHDALPIYLQKIGRDKKAYSPAYACYEDPYLYLLKLKEIGIEDASIYNYFIKIESETLNRDGFKVSRSEEHTSELQSRENLVCRLLLEKKK